MTFSRRRHGDVTFSRRRYGDEIGDPALTAVPAAKRIPEVIALGERQMRIYPVCEDVSGKALAAGLLVAIPATRNNTPAASALPLTRGG